jgi:hypothetical protein
VSDRRLLSRQVPLLVVLPGRTSVPVFVGHSLGLAPMALSSRTWAAVHLVAEAALGTGGDLARALVLSHTAAAEDIHLMDSSDFDNIHWPYSCPLF